MDPQTVTGLTSITSGLTSMKSERTLRVRVPSCSVAVRAKRAFLLDFTRSVEGGREWGNRSATWGTIARPRVVVALERGDVASHRRDVAHDGGKLDEYRCDLPERTGELAR